MTYNMFGGTVNRAHSINSTKAIRRCLSDAVRVRLVFCASAEAFNIVFEVLISGRSGLKCSGTESQNPKK